MSHRPHFPKSFIEEVVAHTDIVSLIRDRIPLKKQGREFAACCPFHQEKTPSFTVSPTKQFYHCFGCGAHGTAIDFLKNYETLSFREAVEELAELANIALPQTEQTVAAKTTPSYDRLYDINQQASRFFQAQLRQHPTASTAIEYLKNRGLTGEICKQFHVGFAPAGWDNLIQHVDRKAQGLLLEAGLITENERRKRYDRFRHRLIFPIQDKRGRVIGFGGRVLDPEDSPKYLNSPETPLFQKGRELYGLYQALHSLDKKAPFILVEGYLDVLALAQHDITHPVATLGTATTRQHLQQLLRHRSEVICCFDGDKAGRKAAWRALEVALPLLKDDVQMKFMFLPEQEDPDSLLRNEGRESFLAHLDAAQSFSEYLFEQASTDVDITQVDGCVRLSKQLIPLLKQLPEGLLQTALIQQLAALTHIDETILRRQMHDFAAQRYERPTAPTKQAPAEILEKTPIRRAIAMALKYPQTLAPHAAEIDCTDIQVRGIDILTQLLDLIAQGETVTTNLLAHWHERAEYPYLSQLVNWEFLITETAIYAEFCDCLAALRQESIQRKIDDLWEKSSTNSLDETERLALQRLLQLRV